MRFAYYTGAFTKRNYKTGWCKTNAPQDVPAARFVKISSLESA
jgi:hypothetical protein